MNRSTHAFLALGAAFGLSVTAARAQSNGPVDIGLFQNGSELEVKLRPSTDFSGIVSSVVFTLRWENGSGAAVSEMVQRGSEQLYVPTRASGPVHDAGVFSYQIYAGFGMESLESHHLNWEAGQEYTIAKIPVSGNGNYVLADDAWSKEDQNNGAFYVSLNGEDQTGGIYRSAASSLDGASFSVTPNPSRGLFSVVIPTTPGQNTSYEVVSASGQVVVKKQLNAEGSVYREDMDLTTSGAGTYHLRIFRDGSTETHKLIVN